MSHIDTCLITWSSYTALTSLNLGNPFASVVYSTLPSFRVIICTYSTWYFILVEGMGRGRACGGGQHTPSISSWGRPYSHPRSQQPRHEVQNSPGSSTQGVSEAFTQQDIQLPSSSASQTFTAGIDGFIALIRSVVRKECLNNSGDPGVHTVSTSTSITTVSTSTAVTTVSTSTAATVTEQTPVGSLHCWRPRLPTVSLSRLLNRSSAPNFRFSQTPLFRPAQPSLLSLSRLLLTVLNRWAYLAVQEV